MLEDTLVLGTGVAWGLGEGGVRCLQDPVPLRMHLAVALLLLSCFFINWNIFPGGHLLTFTWPSQVSRIFAAVTRLLAAPWQPLPLGRDRKGQAEGYCASQTPFGAVQNTFSQYHCDAPNSAFPGRPC